MFNRLLGSIVRRTALKVGASLDRYRNEIARYTMPSFANKPRNLQIELPRRLTNPHLMEIGDDVALGPNCFLAAITEYPSRISCKAHGLEEPLQRFEPRLVIGNRVSATSNLTVAAMYEIVIGDDVMFASNINLTDALHGYASGDEPYKYQPMGRGGPIRIGAGSWIGQNVVVLPGVTVGERAIIGANSVVTTDLPPCSIAVGAPARVIRQWNGSNREWSEVS